MDWDKESYPSLHSLNIHLLIMCWWSSLIGGSSGLIEFYVVKPIELIELSSGH
jgi:hypothetical protein